MDMNVKIKGVEYPLATTLRVAYMIQGQHNHKAYLDIFQGLESMKLDDQIRMIYASFKCANKDTQISEKEFIDEVLDNYGLMPMMQLIRDIIDGITYGGMSEEERAEKKAEMEAAQAQTQEVPTAAGTKNSN